MWFVELANVSDDADVASTVARTLQLAESPGHEIDLVCDYIAGRFAHPRRHLADGDGRRRTAAITACRCTDLQVLTTTREPLLTPGEQIVHLSGLDEAAAGSVFVARARAVNPMAALDDDQVLSIVRKLDGLPLALELAAARDRLAVARAGRDRPWTAARPAGGDSRTRDPRHLTMRAVIGWSHDLLEVNDRGGARRTVGVRGAIRPRGSTCRGQRRRSQAVEHLLARSLLARDLDLAGQARYRFLDLIRRFAQEQATPKMGDRARRRHLEYHVTLAARLESWIRTAEATACAAVARGCADDLRTAVSYAGSQRSASAGRVVADLYWPWFLDGFLAELQSWATAASISRVTRASTLVCCARAGLGGARPRDTAAAVDAARRQLRAQHLPDEGLWHWPSLLGMAAWAGATTPPPECSTGPPSIMQAGAGNRGPSPSSPRLQGRSAHEAGDHDAELGHAPAEPKP